MLDHKIFSRASPILTELFDRQIPHAGTRTDHRKERLQDTCSCRLFPGHFHTTVREYLAEDRSRISLARDNHIFALGGVETEKILMPIAQLYKSFLAGGDSLLQM